MASRETNRKLEEKYQNSQLSTIVVNTTLGRGEVVIGGEEVGEKGWGKVLTTFKNNKK